MNLSQLREQIDGINAEIIALFAKRLAVVRQIAKLKKGGMLPLCDPEREEEQRLSLRALAAQHGIPPLLIEGIFALLLSHAKEEMRICMEEEL